MAKDKPKYKDIDFLYSAARIRSLETKMLDKARANRLLDARSDAEAVKLLSELGMAVSGGFDTDSTGDGDGSAITPSQVESAIKTSLREAFELCEKISPDKSIAALFRVKYDYHNLKTLLKAEVTGNFSEAEGLLSELGRTPPAKLREQMLRGGSEVMTAEAASAVAEARDYLARTRDARGADIILDRAMYAEMRRLAGESGAKFAVGYVELMIDSVNLRTIMRVVREKGSRALLGSALIEGGSVSTSSILRSGDVTAKEAAELFAQTSLAEAAAKGESAIATGALFTPFEKAVKDAEARYLRGSALVPFGPEPIISYLANKELEARAVRTVMLGRMAGLDPEVIRERLGEIYA